MVPITNFCASGEQGRTIDCLIVINQSTGYESNRILFALQCCNGWVFSLLVGGNPFLPYITANAKFLDGYLCRIDVCADRGIINILLCDVTVTGRHHKMTITIISELWEGWRILGNRTRANCVGINQSSSNQLHSKQNARIKIQDISQ